MQRRLTVYRGVELADEDIDPRYGLCNNRFLASSRPLHVQISTSEGKYAGGLIVTRQYEY